MTTNLRFGHLGEIPVQPVLEGAWPFDLQRPPPAVDLGHRRFELADWAWPYERVISQYREVTDRRSAHLMVYNDRTWKIEHLDEWNPDRGHVVKHFVTDTPVGKLAGALLLFGTAMAVGYGVGLLISDREKA